MCLVVATSAFRVATAGNPGSDLNPVPPDARTLLPQPLADFARAFPGIEVEVVENAFLADLSRRHADESSGWARREADVAIRLSHQVAEHLVGRQLGMTHCRVYARRGAPGLPQTVLPLATLLKDAPWVAFERDSQARVYDHWMLKHLAQKIQRDSEFRALLSINNTARRIYTYLSLLQKKPEDGGSPAVVENLPTHQDIANMINTSRETVTRALLTLVQQGIVQKEANRLVILDPQALQKLIQAP